MDRILHPLKTLARRFARSQSGAVTVDWTVLAASVVGLGLTSAAAVRTGVVSLGGDIDGALAGAEVAAMGQLGLGAYRHVYLDPANDEWVIQHFVDNLDYTKNVLEAHYPTVFRRSLAEGDFVEAGYCLDRYVHVREALRRAGVPLNDNLPDPQILYAEYVNAGGPLRDAQ